VACPGFGPCLRSENGRTYARLSPAGAAWVLPAVVNLAGRAARGARGPSFMTSRRTLRISESARSVFMIDSRRFSPRSRGSRGGSHPPPPAGRSSPILYAVNRARGPSGGAGSSRIARDLSLRSCAGACPRAHCPRSRRWSRLLIVDCRPRGEAPCSVRAFVAFQRLAHQAPRIRELITPSCVRAADTCGSLRAETRRLSTAAVPLGDSLAFSIGIGESC